MSLSTRVSRHASGQILGRLYTSTLAFVITVVVLPRTLDESLFGIFAYHLTLWQLLHNVLDFGMGTIVTRESSKRRGEAGELIGLLVVIKGLLSLLGVAVLVGAAWIQEGPGTRFLLLLVAAPLLLAHAPAAASVIFHVDLRLKPAVISSVAGQTAWLLGTLALAWAGVREPGAYLIAFGLGIVVNAATVWFWARGHVRVQLRPRPGQLSRLWKVAWPAGVSISMASVYFYVDALMLRWLISEQATGHYVAASRVMSFALMVPVLASNALFPVFARLHESGGAALGTFFERSVATLGAFGLGIAATLPLVADDIMALLFPEPFQTAAPTLAILALAIAVVFCTYPHVLLVLAAGGQVRMMWVSIGAAVFNVLANLWLIPVYGLQGAALTTVATELCVLGGAALAGRRLTGHSVSFAVMRRPLAAALGAAALTLLALAALPADAHLLRLASAFVAGLIGLALSGVLPVDLGTEEGAPQ